LHAATLLKTWPWIPIYFKRYHCCWKCGRGRRSRTPNGLILQMQTLPECYSADEVADPKFQDQHISGRNHMVTYS